MGDGGWEGGYSGEENVKRSEIKITIIIIIIIMIEELEKAEMIIFDKLVGWERKERVITTTEISWAWEFD